MGEFGRGGGWGGGRCHFNSHARFRRFSIFSFQGAFLGRLFLFSVFSATCTYFPHTYFKDTTFFLVSFFYLRRPIWESALCEMWSTFSLLPLSSIGRGNWNCPRKGRRRRGVKIGGKTVTEMPPQPHKAPRSLYSNPGLGLMDIHMENGNRCLFLLLFFLSIRGGNLCRYVRHSFLPPPSAAGARLSIKGRRGNIRKEGRAREKEKENTLLRPRNESQG